MLAVGHVTWGDARGYTTALSITNDTFYINFNTVSTFNMHNTTIFMGYVHTLLFIICLLVKLGYDTTWKQRQIKFDLVWK